MLLQAVLDLGNMLNSGTKKGGASGFKISNLLRKSSDKTTTALKFLLIELETQHSVALDTFLQRDMTHLKTASGDGQLKFIADSIKELQRDMGSLKTELNVTQMSLTAEANDDLLSFSRKLGSFYTAKSAKLADLQAREVKTQEYLWRLSVFLGERFATKDACSLLETMQSVVALVVKSCKEIQDARARIAMEEARGKRVEQISSARKTPSLRPLKTA